MDCIESRCGGFRREYAGGLPIVLSATLFALLLAFQLSWSSVRFRDLGMPYTAWARSSIPLPPNPLIPTELCGALQEGENTLAAEDLDFEIPWRMAKRTDQGIPASMPLAGPAHDVVEFQPHRSPQVISNARGDSAVLTNLNPRFGAWYLLEFALNGKRWALHLEAAAWQGRPECRPRLALYRDGLELTLEEGKKKRFPLWPSATGSADDADLLNGAPVPIDVLCSGFKSKSPFIPICEGRVFIRRQQPGSATGLEYTTDLLRSTSLGTWIVEAAKPYLIQAPELGEEGIETEKAVPHAAGEAYPLDAEIGGKQARLSCKNSNLGIESEAQGQFQYGKWYKTAHHPNAFVSIMKPAAAAASILDSYRDRVAPLGIHDGDRKEAEALVYLMALDMAHFRFGYSMGADHPKVEWSRYALGKKENGGPDGFGTLKPLNTVGALAPYYLPYVCATFVGGFKREHSAFYRGPFSKINRGSHYGFGENGVICSMPQPGLATAAIAGDGDLELFTWPENASGLEQCYAHFRQNGLPIIEALGADGASIPGKYCNNWVVGQWSGDQHGNVVTLRSGLAIQVSQGRRFLIFAHFSGATPSAMARVFQAYRCSYAMQLDMNTPNYCFASLYQRDAQGGISGAEYLHKDMKAGNGLDRSLKFIQKNDTRDFFYVIQRL